MFAHGQKLYIRGVTYGTFRSREDGHEYPAPEVVDQDFASMAANGITAVRTYTVPPRSLLDAAARHGLRVMVGVPVERLMGYLIDSKGAPNIEGWLREKVRSCSGHDAILCYSIGNEIPAPVVRWHGRRRIERFIERLCEAAKQEDPESLVTYVNYPSTEYLHLPFLDLVCFNVYLERRESLEAYLARLQNLAGDRPLILGEIGLDSLRHGEEVQTRSLQWQLRSAFRAGCAGAFVYAWTDEWFAGGEDMTAWAFGLMRCDRRPKPALEAVRTAFAEVPFPANGSWPRISVVVCSYNGANRIRDCFQGLQKLDYPNFEVIVVDDGSTDDTGDVARGFGLRVIRTEQCGLSHARNTGLQAATGEIVAYIDDDAYPDPHWLTYLAEAFASTDHAAIGGPNIPPPDGDSIGECFAQAPGAPVHVLLNDQEAEHIPGCNMAFRKSSLEAIGGFDTRFRVAGDDVDVCWRLQAMGWTLGFSPAAMVWHHPRRSLRTYWRQQKGYGVAEALLEAKWPEKYNPSGHLTWAGHVYTKTPLPLVPFLLTEKIYHGIWGSAPFQRLYAPAASTYATLPLAPEWYLLCVGLAFLSALGFLWKPLSFCWPLFALALGLSVTQAMRAAARVCYRRAPQSRLVRLSWRALSALLFLLHPLARLRGRLLPGRARRLPRARGLAIPWPKKTSIWTRRWGAAGERLATLQALLGTRGAAVRRGGEFDQWDLEVQGGRAGSSGIRLLMAVEEHGQGQQLVRLRWWPRWSRRGLFLCAITLAPAALAAQDRAWAAALLLGLAGGWVALRALKECAAAAGQAQRAVSEYAERADEALVPLEATV